MVGVFWVAMRELVRHHIIRPGKLAHISPYLYVPGWAREALGVAAPHASASKHVWSQAHFYKLGELEDAVVRPAIVE